MLATVHNAQTNVKREKHRATVLSANHGRLERAQRLRAARIAAGFTSAQAAAKRFGWSEDTYAQHENGTRGITRAYLKYARALRVRPEWLWSGVGDGPAVVDAEAEAQINELLALARGLTSDRLDRLLGYARDAKTADDIDRARSEGDPSADQG